MISPPIPEYVNDIYNITGYDKKIVYLGRRAGSWLVYDTCNILAYYLTFFTRKAHIFALCRNLVWYKCIKYDTYFFTVLLLYKHSGIGCKRKIGWEYLSFTRNVSHKIRRKKTSKNLIAYFGLWNFYNKW